MNTIPSDTTLRAAEWVLPGHPDKLADAVADALVQAAQQRQAEALCAIEVAVHREQVFLTGRLACEGADQLPLSDLVREVYRSAGYGAAQAGASQAADPDATQWRPAPQDLTVAGNLCVEPLVPGEERIRHISDDQSIVTGYAIDLPGIGCIPPEQWLAREVARRLFALVHSPLQLCPDGKVLVVLEETGGEHARWRLQAVSCSLLAPCGDIALQRAAAQAVREAAHELSRRLRGFDPAFEPGGALGTSQAFVVNGSGTFSIGGPEGDNGLSGKKLLLDHYGPRVPIGGTALSGKDFWKPDRAGTLLARRLALAVVRSGVATEATVQFVSFPGDEAPRLVRITTPQADLPEASRWLQLIDCRFETTSAWGLGIDLVECARWGWFGVDEPGLAWEALGLR